MSGRKIRMWKSQKNEGRGRKEAWKPEFRPLGSSNIRQEADEARKQQRDESRFSKEKPKEEKGLRR